MPLFCSGWNLCGPRFVGRLLGPGLVLRLFLLLLRARLLLRLSLPAFLFPGLVLEPFAPTIRTIHNLTPSALARLGD